LKFNDDFENFILCFSVSHGAIEHLISFFYFTFPSVLQRKSLRDSGADGSSICAGTWQYIFTMAFLSAESNTH
jgi:hypothetical protein